MMAGVIIERKDIHVELLMQIISLVDDQTMIKASGVCCGWRDSIFFGLARLSLSWCSKSMNNLVISVVPKFAKLQTLILRQDKPQLNDSAVGTSVENSKFLISKFSGCSAFSDNALAYLAGFCRKLKVLNLCGCARAASDTALKAIGHYCNQMQSLNLGWCDKVGDVGVISLAYGCPDLGTVDLCGCVYITDILGSQVETPVIVPGHWMLATYDRKRSMFQDLTMTNGGPVTFGGK